MKTLDAALTPVKALGWAAGVVGMEKSFKKNPILGSRRLNRWGLHRERVRLADALARRRRAALARRLPEADVAAFEKDGFVVKRNFLPEEVFEALRHEAFAREHPAREMRQGQTVTRMIPVTRSSAARLPTAARIVEDPALRRLIGFVAGRSGAPVFFIQTVIAEPSIKAADPQTALHADTFHATSKMWLFLHDVPEDAGPFIFAPGSHRLTKERIDWEYEQSLTARDDKRNHHAQGSFRISLDEIVALGYGAPRRMAVPGNTLVVADTFGFHGRSPSDRPTIRTELHGHLRRNPFLPWNGLDWQGLPGVRGRQLDLFYALEDFKERRLGKRSIWRDVGAAAANAPARI